MIIIITGATHVGKTNLAQKLLEKYKYPYLSLDHLKMGLIRANYTDLTTEDDIEMTKYLWPIVTGIIKTAIENNQNLIIEGCYIPFDYKMSFEPSYSKYIKYICLAFEKGYILNNFNIIKEKANVIEKRLSDEYLPKEYIIKENEFYIENCNKNNLDILIIKNDYEKEINEYIKII